MGIGDGALQCSLKGKRGMTYHDVDFLGSSGRDWETPEAANNSGGDLKTSSLTVQNYRNAACDWGQLYGQRPFSCIYSAAIASRSDKKWRRGSPGRSPEWSKFGVKETAGRFKIQLSHKRYAILFLYLKKIAWISSLNLFLLFFWLLHCLPKPDIFLFLLTF